MNCTPLPDIRSIAILRANALGDFVFALPALAALRRAYPDARLVLLGQAWHAGFLARRGVVDEVVALPPVPGVTAPSDAEDGEAVERCCAELRARHFDLALQLHGGGRHSNPFVRRLAARTSVGLCAEDAPALDRNLPYVPCHNERLRLLEAVALAGAAPAELEPALPVLDRDRDELAACVPLPRGPLAVLNPGAADPRRRWPPKHFAAVGDALAREGAALIVQGGDAERELSAAVVAAMHEAAVDAGGKLSLTALAALLARARLVVSNDSGPLHLAQAVGSATLGIYWYSNLLVSGPLFAARHRHVVSHRLDCPVCGAVNLERRCAHDASFVAEVSTEAVIAQALALWRQQAGAEWRTAAAPAASAPAAALLRALPH